MPSSACNLDCRSLPSFPTRRSSDLHPDLIYAHGLLDPELEARTLAIAPGVFCAHAYYGTCISGGKTFKFPVVTPCNRPFGWHCLIQDRKSTRLNSSHTVISYAVFCLQPRLQISPLFPYTTLFRSAP